MAKVKLGNVKGSKGDKGDRGSLWRVSDKMTGQSTSGTAFPGAGFEDSVVNDICLNPTTFDLYRCQTAGNAAAAKWVWECNIKGAPGPKGDKGDPTTVDAALSKDSTNPIQNKVVATKFQDVQDSLGHAGRLFSGDLGRLSIDGAGHIKLWTNAEFKEKFGAEPKTASSPCRTARAASPASSSHRRGGTEMRSSRRRCRCRTASSRRSPASTSPRPPSPTSWPCTDTPAFPHARGGHGERRFNGFP